MASIAPLVHNYAMMSFTLRCVLTGLCTLLMFGFPLAILTIGWRQVSTLEQRARDQLIAAGRPDAAAQLAFRDGRVNFGMEVTSSEATWIFLADLVTKFWWCWLLTAIFVSYGVFCFTGYLFATPNVPESPVVSGS